MHSPIDRIGGVICSDLKGPLKSKDRLGNRYLINFIDHKINYCRVFLAHTEDEAAKKFKNFLIFFEKRFDSASTFYEPVVEANTVMSIYFVSLSAFHGK